MKNQHFLIIEDRPNEAAIARQTATSLGIETRLAPDFNSALNEIKSFRPLAIASDLFFPSGGINQEPYVQQILPIYEAHLQTFKPITDGPLFLALEFVLGGNKDKTKEELWNEFIRPVFLKDWSEDGIEEVKDAHFEIQFYSRYEKLQKHIEGIKQGTEMPYGLFAVQEAERLGIPVHIVTSTNHHDISFEPIRGLITCNYTDNLVDGHKDWARAFEHLSQKLKI